MTFPANEQQQLAVARKIAEKLSQHLTKADSYRDAKVAVMLAVEAFDTRAAIIGDGDIAALLEDAQRRRGKKGSVTREYLDDVAKQIKRSAAKSGK